MTRLEIEPRSSGLLANTLLAKPMSRFGLVSLFNGISTFVGYLMPKPFS